MTQHDDKYWKQKLTADQYQVLREKGTEAPFSGELLDNKDVGNYLCVACKTKVFGSDTKFDSGSGWPSFYNVADKEAVRLVEDTSHGMHRVEIQCANCGSHLGHVFQDAPQTPTGMRFCVNSTALKFSPDEKGRKPSKDAA